MAKALNLQELQKHAIGIVLVLGFLVWISRHHSYDVKEVDVPGARALIDGGALVVDVRGPGQFNERHIPGAINVALDQLRAGIPASLRSVATDRSILVYCGDGASSGPEGTHLLNEAGYTNAVNLKSGIQGWAGAGQAVAKR